VLGPLVTPSGPGELPGEETECSCGCVRCSEAAGPAMASADDGPAVPALPALTCGGCDEASQAHPNVPARAHPAGSAPETVPTRGPPAAAWVPEARAARPAILSANRRQSPTLALSRRHTAATVIPSSFPPSIPTTTRESPFSALPSVTTFHTKGRCYR